MRVAAETLHNLKSPDLAAVEVPKDVADRVAELEGVVAGLEHTIHDKLFPALVKLYDRLKGCTDQMELDPDHYVS